MLRDVCNWHGTEGTLLYYSRRGPVQLPASCSASLEDLYSHMHVEDLHSPLLPAFCVIALRFEADSSHLQRTCTAPCSLLQVTCSTLAQPPALAFCVIALSFGTDSSHLLRTCTAPCSLLQVTCSRLVQPLLHAFCVIALRFGTDSSHLQRTCTAPCSLLSV